MLVINVNQSKTHRVIKDTRQSILFIYWLIQWLCVESYVWKKAKTKKEKAKQKIPRIPYRQMPDIYPTLPSIPSTDMIEQSDYVYGEDFAYFLCEDSDDPDDPLISAFNFLNSDTFDQCRGYWINVNAVIEVLVECFLETDTLHSVGLTTYSISCTRSTLVT